MKNFISCLLIVIYITATINYSQSQVTTIPSGTGPFVNLGAAFTAINAGGVYSGVPVTVNINANLVEPATANLNGNIFTSCLIRPQGGNWTVTADIGAAIVLLAGADNVTIDGLNTGGNSLTFINTNTSNTSGTIQMSDGATFNKIKNITCNAFGSGAAGARNINIAQSIGTTSGNNDNLIENCLVNGGRRGIQNFGTAGLFINERNTVKNNIIKNASSISIFIGSETSSNLVDGNEIFFDASVTNDALWTGINVQGCGSNTVKNNRIHDISGTVGAGSFTGIVTIPVTFTSPIGTPATSYDVYNNMVSFNTTISSAGSIYGMLITAPTTGGKDYLANVYYNSVNVAGTNTAIGAFTAGIYVDNKVNGSFSNVMNNLSLNERLGGDVTTQHIGGLIAQYSYSQVSADYNVWIATDPTLSYNAGWNNTLFNYIYSYRDSAINGPTIRWNEIHSVFSTTFGFIDSANLHLDPSTIGGSLNGSVVGLVATDIDGQTRSSTLPYRGADELIGVSEGFNEFELKVAMQGDRGFHDEIYELGLAQSSPPYHLVAIASERVYDHSGLSSGYFYFGNYIDNGSYYVIAFQRNHLETWSANSVSYNNGGYYYFSFNIPMAYGSNQVIWNGRASIYGGDVNQDGIVDGSDASGVDNASVNFDNGLYKTFDITSDGIVDGTDAAFVDNNASNFVSVQKPTILNALKSNSGLMAKFNVKTTAKVNKYIKSNILQF